MKKFMLLTAAVLLSCTVFAGNGVVVDQGKCQMMSLGDHAEIAYAFAKGDKITVDAKSSKMLDRMIIVMYPQTEIGRDRATKHASKEFVMPQNGIVVIRFVADRGGSTNVNYTITRVPASDAVRDYQTKVIWQKPTDHVGPLEPVQAK